ncbi:MULTISPECIES: thioredoxin family protein [Roseobacteraceae]|jgi:thiol:disulfide interchange protein|uniref:Thioredoxin n=1 Tax=Pseudosulfitobacter pseudonitzschiae TaxID=1402135 RepID=A0A221K485_9RHOB|nr:MULTISPECIES: thioredoxin family protein [Roseobacteraceae]ASM73824.1 thioredoxin [Pseudosulfitobacter pseudonitzschiae]
MNRRAFLTTTSAALALPHVAFAFQVRTFTPALWDEVRSTDQVVILNFRANWSLTCQIKQELIATAITENPAYGQLQFINVNWDTYGRSRMAERLKVERRSTLLVMKNGSEIARLVNEPHARKIQSLMDTALDAR